MNLETPENIVSNAEYHAKLLATIAELEYVPQAERDQIEYIKDLEIQIESGRRKISQLGEKTKKERKEHESLRDSVARRFAHVLIGQREKFAQKASKEEREYVEALEREVTEKDNQNMLIRMKEEGYRVLEDLRKKGAKRQSTEAELQALYGRVFDGPTAAFPEDDRLEYELIALNKRHEQAQAKVNAESRAADLLSKAVAAMTSSHQSGMQAVGYSTYDMLGGGGFSDALERSALRRAQIYASQAVMLFDQARRISPVIQPLPKIYIAEGSLLGDVFFDNIFSDIAFHRKVKESVNQILIASHKVMTERDNTLGRLNVAGAELVTASKSLEAKRRELDAFRRATFANYVVQHPSPPTYNSVTTSQGVAIPGPELQAPASAIVEEEDKIRMPEPNPTSLPPDSLEVQYQVGTSPGLPEPWGKNNPFAYALSEQTRNLDGQ